MERRDLLRIGTAVGALYLGERLRPLAAATAAGAKPLTSAYSGTLERLHHEGKIFYASFGVFRGQVSGTVYVDDVPAYSIYGTLKKGTLEARAVTPGKDDLVNFTFGGKVKRGHIQGAITNEGGFPGGTFSVTKWKPDTKEMRSLAGDYEGIVAQGPGFIGKCQIKSNGTFRLYDVVDPDEKPISTPIPGYYLIQKSSSHESAKSGVEGGAGAVFMILFFLCAGNKCCWEDRPRSGDIEARLKETTKELLERFPPDPQNPLKVFGGHN